MAKLKLLLVLIVCLAAGTLQAQDATPEAGRGAPPDSAGVQLVQVASGFDRPLFLTHAGDGSGRIFIVTQSGKIWIMGDSTGTYTGERTVFLDVSDLISPEVFNGGYTERGLLGLAFAPDYATSGVFYVDYTDLHGNTVLASYHVSADNPDAADPNSATIILTQQQPYANHNGGDIAFGPDGYLYVAFGDGGSAGDPQGNGQNLSTWLGSILRIDVSADGYTVPADNPFVNTSGAQPEIWAYGLRNPWRFSFDAVTGDLYIGDVGQAAWEEVDFQPAGDPGGENYGWNAYEGFHPYSGAPAPANMTLPIAEYSHFDGSGIAVTGGYVYRGAALPQLDGVYFYGDYGTGNIWYAYRDTTGTWQSDYFMRGTGTVIGSFGQDEANELYIADVGSGAIKRFEPAS